MIRNLKALLLAGMALAVFGALAVSSAQAHTPAMFHSHLEETTLTTSPDGTGKTAHAVFDVPGGGSLTCAGFSSHGLVNTQTATSADVTIAVVAPCTFAGTPITVDTANCVFGFKASGEVELKGVGCNLAATLPGCEIKFTTPNAYAGVTFHDISSSGETLVTPGTATYLTASLAISGILGTQTGAGCPSPGAFTNGQITTGNVTIEGEKVGTTEMTSVWWTPTAP